MSGTGERRRAAAPYDCGAENHDRLNIAEREKRRGAVGRLNPASWPQHAWDWFPWAGFSYPFNFTGQPAATVPAGFTAAGLPVGLQIVGRRFDDLTVLQASAAFETARPWAARRPPGLP